MKASDSQIARVVRNPNLPTKAILLAGTVAGAADAFEKADLPEPIKTTFSQIAKVLNDALEEFWR